MRRYLLFALMTMFAAQLHAGVFDSLSIGLGAGYESYQTFKGELYMRSDIKIFNRNSEIKAGFNNRSYQLDFDSVSDLDAQSVGIFADVAVYPFNKGLFTGIRWEMINFNWFTASSKAKFENERHYTPTSLYTGTCIFFQLGYHFELSDKMGLKLYGQPGIQQYKITNGSSSSGSYVQGSTSENLIMEEHVEFIYNINMSFEFRF